MFVSRWSFARQTRVPAVQKCPFQLGDLHTPTGTYPQVEVFTIHILQGPISPVSKPFQLWSSLEMGQGTKMYASPNPCTPQRHHGGWRRCRDLKDPSRRKAPTGPVLKDRSWVNSPMGGYGGGLDCSHCPVAVLATLLTAQERKETNDWTRHPDPRPNPMALRQALVPGSVPTGKNATFEVTVQS